MNKIKEHLVAFGIGALVLVAAAIAAVIGGAIVAGVCYVLLQFVSPTVLVWSAFGVFTAWYLGWGIQNIRAGKW